MSKVGRVFGSIMAVAVLLPAVALAGDSEAGGKIHDAESAFELFTRLEGTWEGEALVVPVGQAKEEGVTSRTTVTYKVIANASTVMATYRVDTPMEMVSMYHLDGPEEFIHTHYCAVGNQPSMRFEKSSEKGLIRFNFSHGSNMDVEKDGHVHNTRIRLIDEDTLESESDLWREGKLSSVRYARLTRVK